MRRGTDVRFWFAAKLRSALGQRSKMRLHAGARLMLKHPFEVPAHLLHLDAGFQPANHLHPPVSGIAAPRTVRFHLVVELQWKQHVLQTIRDALGTGEFLRRHADDGDGYGVDADGSPDDIGPGTESRLPVAIAEHRDRRRRRQIII